MGVGVSNDRTPRECGRARASLRRPTETPMSPQIMNEFLKALHLGLGRLDYGVVGDAALYKYGNGREVSHVEVIVPWDLSHMVVPQVVYKKVGFVFIDDPCFEVG